MKPKCLPALILTAGLSAIGAGLGLIQHLIYGRRVGRTGIAAPIFIIGHWRTGTTLLHNLLSLDPRHAAPTGYECACPGHFLLTERWLLPLFDLLPRFRRPMDDMEINARSPQEDEFALELLGESSPYRHFTFPNLMNSDPAGELDPVPAEASHRWTITFLRFLQQLTWLHRRRLVLKSPPHSFRIRLLRDLFPDARFVHIVRNPYQVVPSTLRTNRALLRLWALQETTEAHLETYVLERGVLLYERLEEGKKFVSANRFYELRYEDLIRDPAAQLRRLYSQLELSGFDEMRPKVEQHMARLAGYVPRKHEPDRRLRGEITRRWQPIIERFGYPLSPNPALIQNAEPSVP